MNWLIPTAPKATTYRCLYCGKTGARIKYHANRQKFCSAACRARYRRLFP